MQLVEDWQKAHKLFSVQAAALLAFLLGIQAALPQIAALDPLQPLITSPYYKMGEAILAVAIIVLRVIKQTGATQP